MVLRQSILQDEEVIAEISALLNSLQIPYKNIEPYIIAFVHRSIVNEKPDFTREHNERLEFLWDAVLELVVTSNLYRDFPKTQEWELTDIRSAIVRWRNLAVIAKKLWLSKYLQLWHWEEMWWWRESEYLQANAFEAFVGAMFLDLGFDFVKTFVDKYVYSTLDEIMKTHKLKDYKSLIQEYTQAKFNQTPTYEVLSETWPDHNKMFEVGIYLWEEMIWKWSWTSKKKAQENAAENAYISVKK